MAAAAPAGAVDALAPATRKGGRTASPALHAEIRGPSRVRATVNDFLTKARASGEGWVPEYLLVQIASHVVDYHRAASAYVRQRRGHYIAQYRARYRATHGRPPSPEEAREAEAEASVRASADYQAGGDDSDAAGRRRIIVHEILQNKGVVARGPYEWRPIREGRHAGQREWRLRPEGPKAKRAPKPPARTSRTSRALPTTPLLIPLPAPFEGLGTEEEIDQRVADPSTGFTLSTAERNQLILYYRHTRLWKAQATARFLGVSVGTVHGVSWRFRSIKRASPESAPAEAARRTAPRAKKPPGPGKGKKTNGRHTITPEEMFTILQTDAQTKIWEARRRTGLALGLTDKAARAACSAIVAWQLASRTGPVPALPEPPEGFRAPAPVVHLCPCCERPWPDDRPWPPASPPVTTTPQESP